MDFYYFLQEALQPISIFLVNNFSFSLILAGLFGLIFGSFINVIVYRSNIVNENTVKNNVIEWLTERNHIIPSTLSKSIENFNLSFPSSHCPICKHSLKWYHNIPVFSFIFLKAKCAFCKTSISYQYPIVEILSTILSITVFVLYYNMGAIYVIMAYLVMYLLFIMSVIDIKTLSLPDSLNYSLVFIVFLFGIFNIYLIPDMNLNELVSGALIGSFTLYFIYKTGLIIRKTEIMGTGDIILIISLGALIGIKGTFVMLFMSPFVGLLLVLIQKIFFNTKGNILPFAPPLIISAIIYLIYYKQIIDIINMI